jgi:hypothetical protein
MCLEVCVGQLILFVSFPGGEIARKRKTTGQKD